jgi:hypothetical protein
MMQTLVGMCLVGVAMVIITLLVSYASDAIQQNKVNFVPGHFKAMVTGTFISGALFYLICEIFGVNNWQCKVKPD